MSISYVDHLANGDCEHGTLEIEIENNIVVVATGEPLKLLVGEHSFDFEAKSIYTGTLFARDTRGLRSAGFPITIRVNNRLR